MKHLNKLHDRAELIECWIGLGLMVSAFVLASACGCCRYNCGALPSHACSREIVAWLTA